jgi:hypothetical protein
MRCAGVRGQTPKRRKTTTVADQAVATRTDLIRCDFTTDATAINARWCGDITYINTWEGWLYLATVIDIASRRVVGWAAADHLRTDLVDQALTNAVTHRRPARGVAFHSDRGQYTSTQYVRLADGLGVTLSVGCESGGCASPVGETSRAGGNRQSLLCGQQHGDLPAGQQARHVAEGGHTVDHPCLDDLQRAGVEHHRRGRAPEDPVVWERLRPTTAPDPNGSPSVGTSGRSRSCIDSASAKLLATGAQAGSSAVKTS